jgi:hypothetical protein
MDIDENTVRQLDDTLNSQVCKQNLVARTPLLYLLVFSA